MLLQISRNIREEKDATKDESSSDPVKASEGVLEVPDGEEDTDELPDGEDQGGSEAGALGGQDEH